MMLPAAVHKQLSRQAPDKLYKGADKLSHQLLGASRRRNSLLNSWNRQAEHIHRAATQLTTLTDQQLKAELYTLQTRFRRNPLTGPEVLNEALSFLSAAAERTLGLRPHQVQILGAIILYQQQLAEMATGEGKTLTSALAAILNAWSGRPCHVITANDYLAERDAKQMAEFFRFCHLTTASVTSDLPPDQRRDNYRRSIVYTTSKEILADFLRDQIILGDCNRADRRLLRSSESAQRQQLTMNGLHAAIIDEADCVLIDEAVTPLLISQPQPNDSLLTAVKESHQIIQNFEPDRDYHLQNRRREIQLTGEGDKQLKALATGLTGLWQNEARKNELIRTALSAREFYHLGEQYLVEDDSIVIVDEFTGRKMPQRSWQMGLHQFIELKEGLPLSEPNDTLARLSFQRFFRFFPKLCGLTGTASEAATEFFHIYELATHKVPPNKPCIRKQQPTRYFQTQADKLKAICTEVQQCLKTGQPVLIGTRNITASEKLAELFAKAEVSFQLLNAVNHHLEAEIIGKAGQSGMVTIATNMAGRGTDIKLGEGVAELGGLHVIISERNESQRIDRQLIGRCARQGQPGSFRIYSSLEDEILQRYGNKGLIQLLKASPGKHSERNLLFERTFVAAQKRAQKQASRQRQAITQADEWLAEALAFRRDDLH